MKYKQQVLLGDQESVLVFVLHIYFSYSTLLSSQKMFHLVSHRVTHKNQVQNVE